MLVDSWVGLLVLWSMLSCGNVLVGIIGSSSVLEVSWELKLLNCSGVRSEYVVRVGSV